MNKSLTNKELLSELRLRLDEAHNPGWDDSDLVVFVNNAIYEWVSETYNSAEATERSRSELAALTFEDAPTLSEREFALKGLFTLAVEADYDFQCQGITTTRTVPVRPLKYDTDRLDPYSFGGSNYFPGYLIKSYTVNDQVTRRGVIVSPGVPKAVRTVFIDEAQVLTVDIDGVLENPNKNISLGRLTQLQILDRAVRTITGVAENPFRVQTQSQLEIPAKN